MEHLKPNQTFYSSHGNEYVGFEKEQTAVSVKTQSPDFWNMLKPCKVTEVLCFARNLRWFLHTQQHQHIICVSEEEAVTLPSKRSEDTKIELIALSR